MNHLTLKECQKESLRVLIFFDKICKENNFVYFLQYGTLIGAVRHNGFIPWDDDLDVMMPRKDFDNFVVFAHEHSKELLPFKLCDRTNTENYTYGIPRFTNLEYRYVIESKNEKSFDIGTFIDVYPLDNFCSNKVDALKVFNGCYIINRNYYYYINSQANWWGKTICAVLLHVFMRFTKGKDYSKKIESVIRDYILNSTSDEDKYLGLVAWAGKVVMYEKAKMENLALIEHEFEGHMFPIPKCYDYMLTCSYGNYMDLPPEEQRVATHGYKIYRRVNNY